MPRGRVIVMLLLASGLCAAVVFGAWIQDHANAGGDLSAGALAEALWSNPNRAVLVAFALVLLIPVLVYAYSRILSLEITFDLRAREVRSRRRPTIPFEAVTAVVYVPPVVGGRLASVSMTHRTGRPRLIYIGFRRSEAMDLARRLADATGLPLVLDGYHGLARTDVSWTLRFLLPLIAVAGVAIAIMLAREGLRQGQLPGSLAVGFFLLTLAAIVARVAWIQWLSPDHRSQHTFGPWVYYGFGIMFLLAALALT